jgi:protoheme IX farnesyltransferase
VASRKPITIFQNYLDLTKPRALVMIVFTTAISFLIASADHVDGWLLLHTSLGTTIAAAGSLALNQYLERTLDARMVRTRMRPIPSGRVTAASAARFGWLTMVGGYAYLWFVVNPVCSLATMACGLSYLFWYTPLKSRSTLSSFVGAIPGGLLPVMGWAGARGRLEIGAWILFVILFIWQIPHALIISIRHRDDYETAGMKQLPIISDQRTSSRQMIFNVLVLIPVTLLPAFLNMTEWIYPWVALALGLFLLALVVRYTLRVGEPEAKRVFVALSAYLPLLLLAMYMDRPG